VIDAQDIIELAGELSLDPSVVEKDYVLGWLLNAISHHPELGQSWLFKGGTCLKKVFFETYRFSEDLDFTLLADEQLDQALSSVACKGCCVRSIGSPVSRCLQIKSASMSFRTGAAGPLPRHESTIADRSNRVAVSRESSWT
jgi:hypothetical protein